jgi:hypothetical protein
LFFARKEEEEEWIVVCKKQCRWRKEEKTWPEDNRFNPGFEI